MPDDAETLGLLALVLLTDARRTARTGPTGESIDLEHQDRGRWDADRIEEGRIALGRAARLRRPGPYQLKAAIAEAHAQAPTFADTAWDRIASLYAELHRRDPSPVVAVNLAVATGLAGAVEPGLRLLDAVEAEAALKAYAPLHAARAELLVRAGDGAGAHAAYARAIEASANAAQRADLRERRSSAAGRLYQRSSGARPEGEIPAG